MVKIVILGGTGDVYLICALFDAFKQFHGREAIVVLKGRYACIADMFSVPYIVDDGIIQEAEVNLALQRDYDNVIANDRYFYAHPCFLRTNMRVDHITTKPDASQADMYKIILRIPPDTQLAVPIIPAVPRQFNTVVLITRAVSWPSEIPAFWATLAEGLRAAGWCVIVNDDAWLLKQLLDHCAAAEWVIGPQCGTMSILTTGRFPCRKTFAVASVDWNNAIGFPTRQTYPYAYVTKFSNQDYDVEEYKITGDNHGELVHKIVNGQNALRLWPHDPTPVVSVTMPLTPGDFLDRLAVLTIKYRRFHPYQRAAIEREYLRYVEMRRLHQFPPEVDNLYTNLYMLHESNFELLETQVPATLSNSEQPNDWHSAAVISNKRRIAIKQQIDQLCHAPYQEVKSYYGGN